MTLCKCEVTGNNINVMYLVLDINYVAIIVAEGEFIMLCYYSELTAEGEFIMLCYYSELTGIPVAVPPDTVTVILVSAVRKLAEEMMLSTIYTPISLVVEPSVASLPSLPAPTSLETCPKLNPKSAGKREGRKQLPSVHPSSK